jgi:hypothetical protein
MLCVCPASVTYKQINQFPQNSYKSSLREITLELAACKHNVDCLVIIEVKNNATA